MKIVFVQDLWYEWQATMQLSALAKMHGHKCDIIVNSRLESVVKDVEKSKPDLIAFSVITGSHWYVLEAAAKIKKKLNIPILVGGPHATICTDMIKSPFIDYLLKGEGDISFVLLLEKLNNGGSLEEIPGLYYKQKKNSIRKNNFMCAVTNLDELPFLDRSIYYKYSVFRKEKVRYFYIGRGCKYNCTYCCVPVFYSESGLQNKLRLRSAKSICNEIKSVQKVYPFRTAFFQEDSFAQELDWTIEFLERYVCEVQIPFTCMLRASDINEKLVQKLYIAGCISVLLTVDTGNEVLRRELFGRNENNEAFISSIKLLKKYGIIVSTLNMFGFPGDNLDYAKQTLKFNRKLGVEYPWAMLYRPFPKTAMEKKAIEMGILSSGDSNISRTKNQYTSSLLDQPFTQELENLQKIFNLAIKFPWLADDWFLKQKYLSRFYYTAFCLYSYYREVRLWRKSLTTTFHLGIINYLK